MTRLIPLIVVVVVVAATVARADPLPAAVRAHAVRRTGAIAIDGRLDEAAWASAPKQTGFVQRSPKSGAKATFETTFAILYDDDAIYVGVWLDDPEPTQIRAYLARRDLEMSGGSGDSIAIGFDSYNDRRTAFSFLVNAAGVQTDFLIFDDANVDTTWDAVWTADAVITDRGWTAEFRIPLNQLRFAEGDSHEWGFQVARFVGRTEEHTTWSPWPRSTQQIVSRFGLVDGIGDVKPGRRLELLPYASGGVDVAPVDAGDPLNGHVSALRNVGLDLKYGLGHAFTLSATINPDFGQVEADPSQVNLSANQLFYAEKRPFFLEGIDLFKLPIGVDNNQEGAFYSRRIGDAPDTSNLSYDHIKAPSSTAIYSAAKLSGKTKGGLSVGVLDAVTGEETAEIDASGVRADPIVAPLTNYAVGRVKGDFRDGKTSVGASATAVDRALDGTPLGSTLHDQAYTGGVQTSHRWADNAWQADVRAIGSYVHGSAEAIARTQQLNRHLFQRPDATDVSFDPTRRSLTGFGAAWAVGRTGDTKHWRFGTGGDLRTPGLELNDAGFQNSSDRFLSFASTQYRDDDPGKQLLSWQVNGNVFVVSNLEPTVIAKGFEAHAETQTTDYWSLWGGLNYRSAGWDPVALRGGRMLRIDPAVSGFAGVQTDSRRKLRLSLDANTSRDWTADAFDFGISFNATIQARSNIDVSVGPSWYKRTDPMQYVAQVDDGSGMRHFVFGRIDQTVASMTARVNWTFSPHLSLQAYAQPFVAAGRYSAFKDVNNPHAARFGDRFHELAGTDYQVMNGTIFVDYGGTYSVARPDFDLRQLRSTMVLRWEYRPGSTVFAIWSHGQTSSVDDGRFRLGHDLAVLADTAGENIVMVKANYWIGL